MKKMIKLTLTSIFVFACVLAVSAVQAQAKAKDSVKVTPETYIRAETDRQFAGVAKMAGGVNRFYHFRRATSGAFGSAAFSGVPVSFTKAIPRQSGQVSAGGLNWLSQRGQ